MKGMIGKALCLRGGAVHALDRDPARAAEVYLEWGFDWVMPVIAARERGLANDEPEFYARLRRAGMPIWFLWDLPIPNDYTIAPAVFEFAAQVGATGICLNPEVEWKDRPDDAAVFIRQMDALASQAGLKLSLGAYTRPDMHDDYPWRVFSEVVPIGMPLCFDKDNRFDPSEFTRAAKEYRRVGFTTIIPWGSLYAHDTGTPKTPEQVAAHLALIPPTPGIVFWNGGVRSTEARAAIDVLRGWSPTPVVPAVARALLGPLAPVLFGG